MKYAGLFLLLFYFTSYSQIRKGDAFRNRIDSLNRVAFDNPPSVLKMADQMIMVAKKKKRIIDYGLLLQVKGIAETSLGNNTRALKLHMESYHLFDSIKQNEGKIFALLNLASVQLNLDHGEIAEEYLYKALSLTPKSDLNNLKTIYTNLGVASDYQGKYDRALYFYRIAIPLLEKLKEDNGLSIVHHNIAIVYGIQKKIAEAIQSDLKALHYQKKTGSLNGLAIIALNLASLYTDVSKFDKAEFYLKIGEKASKDSDSPYNMEECFITKAHFYRAKKEFEREARTLSEFISFKDSIRNAEQDALNTEMEKRFKVNLKNTEIKLLKTQKKLDQARLEQVNNTRMVLLFSTIVLGVLIFIIYRNYKLKQKANSLLNSQKQLLEERNLQLENENILSQFETLKNQVSPHFLFNSLNALASLIKSNQSKALEFATAFSKLFRNVLELKEQPIISLEEELEHVNAYIQLQQIRFGENLIVKMDLTPEVLSYYLPPFALQIVIENAIKHNSISTAKPLTIDLKYDDPYLIITNNLQHRESTEYSTKTGIKNIISRYKYITDVPPRFEESENRYVVSLPLLKHP